MEGAEKIRLVSQLGFNGHISRGLRLHPTEQYCIYTIGNDLIIRNIETQAQTILQGHDNEITCFAISPINHNILVSAQKTHEGFIADIVVWNIETQKQLARLSVHQVAVNDIGFSNDGKYLASIGGECDNLLLIWDMETFTAVCKANMGAGNVQRVEFIDQAEKHLITAGDSGIRLWTLDMENRRLHFTQCNIGLLKRSITCLCIDDKKPIAYCGTTTGDVLEVCLENGILKRKGPTGFSGYSGEPVNPTFLEKRNKITGTSLNTNISQITISSRDTRIKRGVTSKGTTPIGVGGKDAKSNLLRGGIQSICLLRNGDILMGTGDGAICHLCFQTFKITQLAYVKGKVTSITISKSNVWIGTDSNSMYHFDIHTHTPKRIAVHPSGAVYCVAFPKQLNSIFATASFNEIAVWHYKKKSDGGSQCVQVLDMKLPYNAKCTCIEYTHDGSAICSAWSDSKIRMFSAETGKLLLTIEGAHKEGVTTLAVTGIVDNKFQIVSGGGNGDVRVWDIYCSQKPSSQLAVSWKEHRGPVRGIQLRRNGKHAISCSEDGSIVVWNLETLTSVLAIVETTIFQGCAYYWDELQLVACASDKHIHYFDCVDGSKLRDLEAANTGKINTIMFHPNYKVFCTGGDDRTLRLWNYESGDLEHSIRAHGDAIQNCSFSPDGSLLITVGSAGNICIWDTSLYTA